MKVRDDTYNRERKECEQTINLQVDERGRNDKSVLFLTVCLT